MKKKFTLKDLIKNRGCYTEEEINELYSFYNKDVTITDILENAIVHLNDKRWFLYNICELTIGQKIKLSYILAKAVSPIFNKHRPDDNHVDILWQAIDNFKNELITKKQLLEKRNATHIYVWYATPAVYSAAAAVIHTASGVIADSNYIETHARSTAFYAVEAAMESKDPIYINLLNQLMIDFVNKN